jgi:prolyl-tRNA synthetase
MRLSRYHAPTLKEAPADAQVVSHQLLIRGGYMRKLAAGIYDLLPLGWRVVHKIETIIREEMNRAGAIEVLLPAAIPGELWTESGRWQQYGPELLRFKDRKGADFCIGPTHEEVIVDLVRRDVRSYRQLPLNLYQIQSKFRDEMRPRAGLMRGREFIMKDAYSFDATEEGAKASYKGMYDAYTRIFKRCGLEFRPVEADTGNIGGSLSHEFQVLADSGEDAIVSCDKCDYAANVEKAELARTVPKPNILDTRSPMDRVPTPGKSSVPEVAEFLKQPIETFVKTMIYTADGQFVAALVRGDHNVNELKLKRLLGASELYLASDGDVEKVTSAPIGFAGPVGLKIPIYADLEIEFLANFVAGANKKDTHLVNVNWSLDCMPKEFVDLRTAAAGDLCARCKQGHYSAFRGIEVGHVFMLGTKYSLPMKCNFLDEAGTEKPMVMGCYGVGVTRIAAAAIEQHNDPSGILWPMALAPFHVQIVSDTTSPECVTAADAIYDELLAGGVEVLYDDRDERLGPKFKDADLFGIPLRITVGKKALAEGAVEWKPRAAKDAERVPRADVAKRAIAEVRAQLGARP